MSRIEHQIKSQKIRGLEPYLELNLDASSSSPPPRLFNPIHHIFSRSYRRHPTITDLCTVPLAEAIRDRFFLAAIRD